MDLRDYRENIIESSMESVTSLDQLRKTLVPNFESLNLEAREEVQHVLNVMVAECDRSKISKFSRMGILEEAPLLRSLLWKMLLDTAPLDPADWQDAKQFNLNQYRSFLDHFFPQGSLIDEEGCRSFVDVQLWNEIQLDTRRTHCSLPFFKQPCQSISFYKHRSTLNYDVMTRILYIWAKIHPEIKYVQGMNELVAPLFYLEWQEGNRNFIAESEVYFMFVAVMGIVKGMHIRDNDDEQDGIMGHLFVMNSHLKAIDPPLWTALEQKAVKPHYYCFRWLALLLAQDVPFFEVIRLWDTVFSFPQQDRHFFLYCCCIGLLQLKREQILSSPDFESILTTIQNFKTVDVHSLNELSMRLFAKFSQLANQDHFKEQAAQSSQQERTETPSWSLLRNTGNYLSSWIWKQ